MSISRAHTLVGRLVVLTPSVAHFRSQHPWKLRRTSSANTDVGCAHYRYITKTDGDLCILHCGTERYPACAQREPEFVKPTVALSGIHATNESANKMMITFRWLHKATSPTQACTQVVSKQLYVVLCIVHSTIPIWAVAGTEIRFHIEQIP